MPMLERLVDFDRLKERLLRGGIAPRHVRRALNELRDHYEDAVRDEQEKGLTTTAAAQAAWTRLGDEDHIVETTLGRPELRSLPARFPGIIFGTGPFLLWVGAIVFTVVGMSHLFDLLKSMDILPPSGTPEPHWAHAPAYAACFFYARILPLVIGGLMLAGAARQRVSLRWPIIGVTIVSLFGGTTDITVKLVTQVGERGELDIGNTLLPLLVPLPDKMGPFQPVEFTHGVLVALLNLAIILTPFLIWQKHREGHRSAV
jgi:hypothetical protein